MCRVDAALKPVELLVCTKCNRADAVGDVSLSHGTQLYEALAADPPDGVKVTPIDCLSNCKRSCSIVLRGEGRWTYVYGNLHEGDHPDIIRDGAQKYAATHDGLVTWRERPEHFRKNCMARIPPMEIPE
nr:DUF1636 domain-containing protein [Hasllibacter sp. MH4015]